MKTNWQIKKLGDMCDYKRGLTYSKKDEADFSDNVVLRANNIDLNSNQLDLSELKYLKSSFKIPDDKKVKSGSLIICTASGSKNHLGKVALIDRDYGYALGGFMAQITPKKEMDSKYLFYQLTTDGFRNFIIHLSNGVNINNLRSDDLREFEVLAPPLSEQKRIVKILDEVFEKTAKAQENTEKNLQNSKELFESYLQNIFANPGKGWGEKRLKEICDFYNGLWTGKKPPFVEVGVIRNTNFAQDGALDYSDIAFIGVEKKQFDKRRLVYGDIILEKSGGGPKQPVGRVVIFDKKDGDFSFSNFTSAIRIKDQKLIDFKYLHKFLFWSYKSGVTEGMQSHSTGIRNLDLGRYKEIKVTFPPLPEQKRIVRLLEEVFEKTAKLKSNYERKLSDLGEFKKSVLKKAFSGKL